MIVKIRCIHQVNVNMDIQTLVDVSVFPPLSYAYLHITLACSTASWWFNYPGGLLYVELEFRMFIMRGI